MFMIMFYSLPLRKKGKKRKVDSSDSAADEKFKEEGAKKLSPEEEKQKADSLWNGKCIVVQIFNQNLAFKQLYYYFYFGQFETLVVQYNSRDESILDTADSLDLVQYRFYLNLNRNNLIKRRQTSTY